jgi:hypothetical protein
MKYMSDQFKNNDLNSSMDSLKCRQILQNTITAGNKQTLKAALSKEFTIVKSVRFSKKYIFRHGSDVACE